jgi:hypothetical protein
MYDTNDTSPRDGITAHYTTEGGYGTLTIRQPNPDAALKEARERCKEGYTLARIHVRGNPTDILWAPEDGWRADAAEVIQQAVKS